MQDANQAAKTRLGLETVAAGKMPRVEHVAIRVAGFDRRAVGDKLKTWAWK